MATGDIPDFSWAGVSPAEWMRTWQAMWRLTPDNLAQPILPGWTFNINSGNSTAPQTEVDVVAKHSYGRQIGRMSDLLGSNFTPDFVRDELAADGLIFRRS